MEGPTTAIESDRPDFTESTETVPPGSIQAEGGYAFSSSKGSTSHEFGELLVRVPAGARAEVLLGFNSYSIERVPGLVQRGLEDMEVGMKVRLIEREELSLLQNVSILVLSTLPTGQRDSGTKAMQPTVKLALGWQLSERLSLESNANYAYASESTQGFRLDSNPSLDVTRLSPIPHGGSEPVPRQCRCRQSASPDHSPLP